MLEDGKHYKPMTGVEIWKNPKNKFLVFQCHYTADPAKRSEEFRLDKKTSMPIRKYMMEYEIHWEAFSGLSVYGDTWNKKVHVIDDDMKPHLGLPILISFDWGLTPSCVIAQIIGSRLFIFREFVAVNMGAERFISMVMKELRIIYPMWGDFSKDYIVFMDPSGAFRKDTDEGTCAKILDQKGFKTVIPGAIPFEERRQSVEEFLTRLEGGLPCMQVSAAYCPMLIKGFDGGYQFKEGQDEIEPSKLQPLKNEYSHVHDALQYLTSRILKISRSSRAKVPLPSYSWSLGKSA